MKAVIWTGYGTPDVLKVGDVPKPVPKGNVILIKIIATTASLGDCELRSLSLPLAFRLPIRLFLGVLRPKEGKTLGQEFAGIVEAVGNDAERFDIGDEVFGQTDFNMGAYAQFMTIKQDATIALKPKNISFEEAACVPLGGLEARHYIRKADLKKRSEVLVIGAGGSIGTMAIQLLKLDGAKVTAVDTGEKFEVMKQAGADSVIDYTKENYISGGKAYDAVLDVVGKIPLKSGLSLLKKGGVYMHANPKISHMLFHKRIGGRDKRIVVKIDEQSQGDLEYLADLLDKEMIKPLIDKTMPLAQIAQAHEYVEAGKKKGNLVIRVDHDD